MQQTKFWQPMENRQTYKQPWLHSMRTDGVFILSPPFVAMLLVVCFPRQFQAASGVPVYYWLILIVFIDVAHVYSTLYRTYFKPREFKNSPILLAIPIACYVAGVLLHSFDGMLFWRILAYLAIYHFIRQQYGFMRLYSRSEQSTYLQRLIDKIAIYTATIYPLYYWHFAGKRNFSWFVENDVLTYPSHLLLAIGLVIYLLIIAIYIVKEITYCLQYRHFNVPRNVLIGGTFISWYFGIVFFNGDLAFTTLNVISHGIPYMALVYIFEKRKQQKNPQTQNALLKYSFGKYWGVLLFMALIVLLAYLEEGLWDGLVWRDHGSIFQVFSYLPQVNNKQLLALLVPLLALPQSTHYVLDGFIWRIRKGQV